MAEEGTELWIVATVPFGGLQTSPFVGLQSSIDPILVSMEMGRFEFTNREIKKLSSLYVCERDTLFILGWDE